MATAESVKEKIQNLISSANTVTGNASTNVADAMAALIAGFGASGGNGGGNGAGFHFGTYYTEERYSGDIVFSTPGGVSHFALIMLDPLDLTMGTAFALSIVGSRDGNVICAASSNAGNSLSNVSCILANGSPYSYYYGLKFESDSVTMVASTGTEKYRRVPLHQKTYVWMAW